MMVGRLAAGGIVRQLVTSQMRQSGNSWGGVSQSAAHFPALGPTWETLPSSEDHKFTHRGLWGHRSLCHCRVGCDSSAKS